MKNVTKNIYLKVDQIMINASILYIPHIYITCCMLSHVTCQALMSYPKLSHRKTPVAINRNRENLNTAKAVKGEGGLVIYEKISMYAL